MKKIRMALDWTANTNHSGFYVAKEKGYYAAAGLEVQLLAPDQDGYAKTPAKKVEEGTADMALCPFESILSYNTKGSPFDAVALAAIFQEDLSAVVSLSGKGIARPRDLDGKSYASYRARYEDKIVEQMVKNDGGQGNLDMAYPDKLGIWETLLTGKYDATWIFMNWEGVHAQNKGIPLKAFKMANFGIPYGYSPVIMAGRSRVEKDTAAYAGFLAATKKGYLHAQDEPRFAADAIAPYVAQGDADLDVLQSQEFTNPYYGNEANWGKMEVRGVQLFLDWLVKHGLEPSAPPAARLLMQDFWASP
ncbi:ABC transporter substrate-binding protein [Maribacter sp. 2307ULW6-5]|uniref:ABC transporter substrate-binding protein n=1 Tax=Maribacter sp. 2307ULW6-5 TaxID=3386275 RepID=UPI0039BCF5BA